MTRAVGLALVVAALAAMAVAAAPAKENPRNPLYAVSFELTRVASDSLKPVGRRVPTESFGDRWGFSPDRSQVVLARGDGELRFVDLTRMRLLGDTRLPDRDVTISGLAWLRADRLVALTYRCCPQQAGVVVLDPRARKLVVARQLPGAVVEAARTRSELILLLAPSSGAPGPARLVVVDGDLGVRDLVLPETLAQSSTPPQGEEEERNYVARQRTPGLAVDRDANRAFVVGDGEPIAEVELGSMALRYHALSGRRLQRRTKVAEGAFVHAEWLGNGRLAVSGERYDGLDPATRRLRSEALGLRVLDTRDWSERMVAADVTHVSRVGDALVTGGGHGLRVFGLDGEPRFHLFPGRQALVYLALGSRVYVHLPSREYAVVDVETGRQMGRRSAPLPALLTGEGGPAF